MELTILIENDLAEGHEDLAAEHGLSFYIQHGGHVCMSDVGMTGKFADNAQKLGCDLGAVEALAVSHHHYDHGGGLGRFFDENEAAPVYIKKSPDVDYVVDVHGLPVRYVGLDRDVLSAHSERIISVETTCEPLPGVHLLTDIPEKYPRPGADQRLKMKQGPKKLPDTFAHEMAMVLVGEAGLVILTGCAHTGVLNMIAGAQAAFPGRAIQAVVGGFHLMREDEKTVRTIGETLLELDVQVVYTGHCTGERSTGVLAAVLDDRLNPLGTGAVLNFD
jgi:7,8-dihydropterin-6-yl-methyl-4-(beta-D-ribofuranosyl)aminobenzene 5'-phosphate synthase